MVLICYYIYVCIFYINLVRYEIYILGQSNITEPYFTIDVLCTNLDFLHPKIKVYTRS
jgi:hypothetical protein